MTSAVRATSRPRRGRTAPLRIAAIYLVAGVVWILFSDALVAAIAPDPVTLSRLQTGKGWFFVAATSALIWFLVRSDVRALVRSEGRLRSGLDGLPDAVVVTAADGRIAYVNASARRLLGLGPRGTLHDVDEYRERFRIRYLDGREVPREELVIARALAGDFAERESLIRRADGADRRVAIVASPVRDDADGPVTMAVAVLHDVTELRRLEGLRDEFVSIAAHELKTPVATIKGYVQLLARWKDGKLSTREAGALSVLDRQCDRLNRLVQDLLQVSRLGRVGGALARERFDLGELAEEVGDRARGVCGREIRVLHDGAAQVVADRTRIDQVLDNLVDNAVKFSPGGGPVEVEVTRAGAEATVTVRDHGIGIPADRRDRVFERFYRAHAGTPQDYGGLGIGLHLSRDFVARHGGRMWFETTEGEGTTFHFALPLAGERSDGG